MHARKNPICQIQLRCFKPGLSDNLTCVLAGDLTYSDNSAANLSARLRILPLLAFLGPSLIHERHVQGTSSTDSYDPAPAPIGTYQPRWDG